MGVREANAQTFSSKLSPDGQGVTKTGPKAFLTSFAAFAGDIKLSHSVFALPFAMVAIVIGRMPVPSLRQALWLLLCMVSARSFAMGMNRLLDRHIDALNPRTKGRKIPAGALTPTQAAAWSLLSASGLIVGAYALSPLAGHCSWPLLGLLLAYSLLKRWTWLTHWYLGMCLGLAPIAVEIALTGKATLPVILIAIAVSVWTAGFDMLYSLQDMEFDKGHRLHSIPERFGPRVAIYVSRASFVSMVICLVAAGHLASMGLLYYGGVAVVAMMLTYEHYLVRDAVSTGRSRHINAAFFTANAYVSLLFLAFALADRIFFAGGA